MAKICVMIITMAMLNVLQTHTHKTLKITKKKQHFPSVFQVDVKQEQEKAGCM